MALSFIRTGALQYGNSHLRLFANVSTMKTGLVLGVYETESEDNVVLTPTAAKYNELVNGKLLKNILLVILVMSTPGDSNMGNDSSAGSSGGLGDGSGKFNKPHPPTNVLQRMTGILEDKSNDYMCPICFDLIDTAYITRCGHTFCHHCIVKCLEIKDRCPKCSFTLSEQDIFPNFLLDELVSKYKTRTKGLAQLGSYADNSRHRAAGNDSSAPVSDGLRSIVAAESANLTLPDVNVMLEVLTQRKHLLEAETCTAQNKLLHEFLKHLLQQKEEQKNQLQKEVALIKKDMEEVENILKDVQSKSIRREMLGLIDIIDSNMIKPNEKATGTTDTFTNPSVSQPGGSTLAIRRKRLHAHFDDFVQCYFDSRGKELLLGQKTQSQSEAQQHGGMHSTSSGLDVFRENLVKFSRYNSLRPLATLNYSSDLFNNSTIVSSIEFDKDNEFFAIAGVTKRIKVFDYGAVIRDTVDIHYPCVEMVSSSKISCVSWNSFHKGMLASSDYEGTVTVWDAMTGQRTKAFQEHEKRCWSVDFNDVDTRLIASGSDDARVKLWALNTDYSVASLEAKANVCCVKFNPRSSCHLAFGSADHCVHYYDLRNMKEALCIFKGHRKAVSYVKFINKEEIVSASTDSQLKMWNINNPLCLRSFVGHVNEKNFVGLATDGDYVACGSENNALYVYYKGLTKQLFSYKFDAVRSILEVQDRREEDLNEFVSAVKPHDKVTLLLVALLKPLNRAGPKIPKGHARVFWGLDETDYSGVAVVGLGKQGLAINKLEEIHEGKESVRAAAAAGCRALDDVEIKDIKLETLGDAEAAAEGAGLSTWLYQGYKNEEKKKKLPKISLYGEEGEAEWRVGIIKAQAQNWARELSDTPANLMTPTIFSQRVFEVLTHLGVDVQVHDKSWAEQKINDCSQPSSEMDEMRADMSGAACVAATIRAAAELKLKKNIVGLIPLTENLPSGHATKPGDLVRAMNGKTIIVDNTDAEGRLILADALCYAEQFNPRFILDIATLTGAMRIALSNSATGVFTNDGNLYETLRNAGTVTGDRVWRFPLWQHFTDEVTKKVKGADINNIAKCKGGGSCTAAAFLREFVTKDTPWMHLDIAGVMGPAHDELPYIPAGMTGRPTRTLIQFLQALC
ncbi:E3 ubiquitin-protein ligase RFWD2 [Trachymyrmex cornetzi]|uniref:Cytosol aminopeptidase n=1 Tax=Trachymyrmex cornetzi TaxID=471704 RepID=A0A195EE03_9HYME|nr:E3 ubiquitin-protein ligase RFWD2 [Trachymyrmex cornetzi]